MIAKYKKQGKQELTEATCKSFFIVRFCAISWVSQSTDICTAVSKNNRNMHAVSTNQIADVLHFNY